MKFFVRWCASVAHLAISCKHLQTDATSYGVTPETVVTMLSLMLVVYFEGPERLEELTTACKTAYRTIRDWLSNMF